MPVINIQAAKTHLSRLVEQAAAGEEVVIAKAGKPLVRLVPVAPLRAPRVPGRLKGKIWIAPDCWEPDPEFEAAIERDDPLLRPLRPAPPATVSDAGTSA